MGALAILALLACVCGAAAFGRTTVGPLQETIRVALHLSDNQIALLQGPALFLPTALAAIPIGLAADRWTRVRLLQLFTTLTVVGSLLTALASSFAMFFAARALVGLTTTVNPLVISLLSDLHTPAARGRATTMVGIGQILGISAAFALGGVLVAAQGEPDRWRIAMLWLSVPVAAAAVLTLWMKEPARTDVISAAERRSSWALRGEVWRHRRVIGPVMVGVIVAEMALGAALVWTAPTFARRFGLAPDEVGGFVAAGLMLSGIAGPIVGGVLADLCHRRGGPRMTLVALLLLALLAAPASLYPFATDPAVATVIFILFKIVLTAMAVMGLTLFTIVIPNELRGLCTGTLVAGVGVTSGAVAPVLVSGLSEQLGGGPAIGQALSIICVATCLLAAAVFATGLRSFPGRHGARSAL